MIVDVVIGVPNPEGVDTSAVAKELPYGTVTVKAVKGGPGNSGRERRRCDPHRQRGRDREPRRRQVNDCAERNANAHHLRHQELRHDEEGARVLDQRGVAYDFHDYKVAGIERASWKAGRERSAGRRAEQGRHHVPQAARQGQGRPTEKKAIALMLAQPSIISGRCWTWRRKMIVGFKPEQYEAAVR
jgi:arsenate reductase